MFSYIKGLLVLAVIFYVAVIYGSSALILLFFSGLGIWLLSLLMNLFRRKRVQVSLEVPITLTEQEKQIKVFLQVKNRKKKAINRTVVVLCIENTTLKQKRYIKQSISRGERCTFQLTLNQAGNYEITMREVRVYDLAGMFYLSKRRKERAEVQVLPLLYPVSVRLTAGVRNFVGDASVYDSLRSGDDSSEIFKLREFQDGDKLKDIHWKLTAKEDKLIVRENSLPKACSTVLLLEGGKGIKGRKQLQDAYLQMAASLSFSMMDRECPHYVAWHSRRFGEVKRIRVDNEESFYEFILYMLQDFNKDEAGSILEEYREKYSNEILMHYFVLKQDLVLYEKDTPLKTLDGENPKRSLEELELIV